MIGCLYIKVWRKICNADKQSCLAAVQRLSGKGEEDQMSLHWVSLPLSPFLSFCLGKGLPALPTQNNQANVLKYSLRSVQNNVTNQKEKKNGIVNMQVPMK